jgi:hypothetical protein
VSGSTDRYGTVGAYPWDCEWAAERAAEALCYLGHHYPEGLSNLRALDEHEEAAHRAAMRADREGYLEALRSYMRAGRNEALRRRRHAGVPVDAPAAARGR